MLRIRKASRGLADLVGESTDALIGRSLLEFMPKLSKDNVETILSKKGFDRSVHTFRSTAGTTRLMAVLERTETGAVFFAETIRGIDTGPAGGQTPDRSEKKDTPRDLEDAKKHIVYLEALVNRLRREQILLSSTGLFSRKILDYFLEAQMARSIRTNLPFALVLCGVDRAQALDQVVGGHSSEMAVAVVAKAVAKHKRNSDLMGHHSPSEFYIIQPDNDLDGALSFAERIRKSLESTKITLQDIQFSVSLSFGCSFFHPTKNHYGDRAEMLSQVEIALFSAASSGGNRIAQALPASALARKMKDLEEK